MGAVQAIFAILFAYLICVNAVANPEISDANRKENITVVKRTCTNNDECAPYGVCEVAGDGEKLCTCKAGMHGDFCKTVVGCEPNKFGEKFCGGGADVECVYDESIKGRKCVCYNSTKLFNYNTKKCQVPCKDDCQNSGTCVSVRDYKFCDCRKGTSGDLCERVDNCFYNKNICGKETDVKCVYDEMIENSKCKCDDPKKLFDFEVMQCRNTCSTNEDCRSFEKCKVLDSGEKICGCPSGKSGEQCEIVIHCMTHYKTCIGVNGTCFYNKEKEMAECNCEVVGKMWNYAEDQKRCQYTCDGNCDNNGVCDYDYDENAFCSCYKGTSGDFCENVHDCDVLKICGSEKEVKCEYDYNIRGGNCVCKNSTKVFDYYEGKCRVPCKDVCRNNGKCKYVRGHKFCSCQPGTSGDLCETVDNCTNFCGTKSDVKCVYNKMGENPTCKCVDLNKSFYSDAKECRTTCKDDCANSGVCEDVEDGETFCRCKEGTRGDLCEIVVDCEPQTLGHMLCGIGEDVKCVYDESKKGGKCLCDDSSKVFRYDERKCQGNTCAEYACHNGGSCIEDGSGAARCYCKVPFTGERCEKGPCISNPCKNGGTCRVKDNTYNCICWGNFYGKLCELENRLVSPSILAMIALIIIVIFILACIGIFLLKMNRKLNTGF